MTAVASAQAFKSDLRASLIHQRKSLSPSEKHRASEAIITHLLAWLSTHSFSHLALYAPLSHLNEIDIFPLAKRLDPKIACYLPRLGPKQSLSFHRFDSEVGPQAWITNAYGILEPPPSAPQIAPNELDIVLLPLVGFDRQGFRLGMGGGFYDRTFAFRRESPHPAKPLLIGCGYAFQSLEQLPHDPWDVPCDRVFTDERQYLPAEIESSQKPVKMDLSSAQ